MTTATADNIEYVIDGQNPHLEECGYSGERGHSPVVGSGPGGDIVLAGFHTHAPVANRDAFFLEAWADERGWFDSFSERDMSKAHDYGTPIYLANRRRQILQYTPEDGIIANLTFMLGNCSPPSCP